MPRLDLAVCLPIFLLTACYGSPYQKPADAAAGQGGGGAGGQGGMATAGTGGASGTMVSDAGVAGADGSSAGATGGTGDAGGGAGGMDAAAGPDGARVSGYVVCGSVTDCPLVNGVRCCYTQMDESSACQSASATCESVGPSNATAPNIRTSIVCDSSNDCASNEICCYSNMYINSSTACVPASSCVDMPPGAGGYTTYRRQVCDPAKVAPTECLSGTCQTGTNYGPFMPPYLYLCL
jgi:hypothetical protein